MKEIKKIMKETLEKIYVIFIITVITLLILCVIAYPITMIFLALNLAFAVTMVKIEIIVGCIGLIGFMITYIINVIQNN